MRKLLLALAASVAIAAGQSLPESLACTDFQVRSADGAVVVGRSMEFAADLSARIYTAARDSKECGMAPDGSRGHSWTSKYGYVALDAFGMDGIVVDGMNEAGLSVEGLWLVEASYRTVTERDYRRAMHVGRFGAWALGNFSKVSEVKDAVSRIRVWAAAVPQIGMVPPIHFALHDAEGGSLVVEFIGGETRVYDNPVGVLTNSPQFPWHVENLRNYVNLTAANAAPITLGGLSIKPAGQGSGLAGMPGDWTPPSRFVRAAMLAHLADRPKDAAGAVNLAEHILNAVDIPLGAIRGGEKGHATKDHTQWAVVKDLSNRVFYVRDYSDLSLRAIDLKRLRLEKGAKPSRITLKSAAPAVRDITGELAK